MTDPALMPTVRRPLILGDRERWIDDCRVMIVDFCGLSQVCWFGKLKNVLDLANESC